MMGYTHTIKPIPAVILLRAHNIPYSLIAVQNMISFIKRDITPFSLEVQHSILSQWIPGLSGVGLVCRYDQGQPLLYQPVAYKLSAPPKPLSLEMDMGAAQIK